MAPSQGRQCTSGILYDFFVTLRKYTYSLLILMKANAQFVLVNKYECIKTRQILTYIRIKIPCIPFTGSTGGGVFSPKWLKTAWKLQNQYFSAKKWGGQANFQPSR